MAKKIKEKGYWNNINNCLEVSILCSSRLEFKRKFRMAYKYSCDNKWLDIVCSHMKEIVKPKNYWTFKQCFEEALKYKIRNDYRKNSPSSYIASLKNGWIDKVCNHMETIGNRYNRCIYVYEFEDNSAYIGLTYNLNERHTNHLKKGPVFKHIQNNKKYKLIQLTKYIDVNCARKKERDYITKYKNDNWNILNMNNGGSIGGGKLHYTKEKISSK